MIGLQRNKLVRILAQARQSDWSAAICENATMSDLDPAAIKFAREQYTAVHPKYSSRCIEWNDIEFLNKVHLCINGQITHACILLLGNPESAHHLTDANPTIM